MKRFLILSLSALALAVAFTPKAEAGCRGGGRVGIVNRVRGWFQNHRGGRFHLFQRSGNSGRSSCGGVCDAGTLVPQVEVIDVPEEERERIEVRVANADE